MLSCNIVNNSSFANSLELPNQVAIINVLIASDLSSQRCAENNLGSFSVRTIESLLSTFTLIIDFGLSRVIIISIFTAIEVRANKSARTISDYSVVGIKWVKDY